MSTIIQIKRSANVTAPLTTDLAEGELAYSQDKSNDGAGAILYIESRDSTNSEVIHKVGGKFYTDQIDNATENNNSNTLIKRDSDGSFAGNVITATTFVGNIVGVVTGESQSANIASFANALTTPRTISLVGDVTGSVSFDGTQNVSITTTANVNSVALGTDTTGDYVANVLAGTGIVVSGQGGETATPTVALGTSGVTANTYGGASQIPVLTIDTYGRVTNAANVSVAGVTSFTASGNSFTIATADGGSFTANIQPNSVELGRDTTGSFVENVFAGTGITLGYVPATEGQTPTINLNNTAVTPGTYGGSANVSIFTVDQQGRITSASNAAISTELSIIGDAGSGTVSLLTQGLRFDGGTGIDTSVNANIVTITNDGVLSVATGFGLSTSAAAGAITLNNTGVTKAEAGTGIGLDATSGNITITNTGVTSVTGTANEVEVSAANGSITVGLPNNVTVGGDLAVLGNLNVSGNVVSYGVENLVVEDSFIQLANNNISTDLIDIGFYGSYNPNGGEHEHAGLFRDASDGLFRLFQGLQGQGNLEPTVNITGAGYSVATLVANLTGGTVSGLTANITVGDGGTGRGTLTQNAILFGQGTSAVGLAVGTSGQVLQVGANGMPVFAGIDGGSY